VARKSKQQAVEPAAKKNKKKSGGRSKKVWKLYGSGAALAAGFLTTRVLDATWKTATGKKPPTKPESPEIADREALAWAALSGMVIGTAKTYATRRAAGYWLKSTGEIPPGMKATDKSATKKEARKARRKLA
jgi:hypothetical protein